MKKKIKKKGGNFNRNQTSFYFEDYIETNIKISLHKNNFFHDRIYLLFFLFLSLMLIFCIKIIHVSLSKIEIFENVNSSKNFHY